MSDTEKAAKTTGPKRGRGTGTPAGAAATPTLDAAVNAAASLAALAKAGVPIGKADAKAAMAGLIAQLPRHESERAAPKSGGVPSREVISIEWAIGKFCQMADDGIEIDIEKVGLLARKILKAAIRNDDQDWAADQFVELYRSNLTVPDSEVATLADFILNEVDGHVPVDAPALRLTPNEKLKLDLFLASRHRSVQSVIDEMYDDFALKHGLRLARKAVDPSEIVESDVP